MHPYTSNVEISFLYLKQRFIEINSTVICLKKQLGDQPEGVVFTETDFINQFITTPAPAQPDPHKSHSQKTNHPAQCHCLRGLKKV